MPESSQLLLLLFANKILLINQVKTFINQVKTFIRNKICIAIECSFIRQSYIGALYFTSPRDPSHPIHPTYSTTVLHLSMTGYYYYKLCNAVLQIDMPSFKPESSYGTNISTYPQATQVCHINWKSNPNVTNQTRIYLHNKSN